MHTYLHRDMYIYRRGKRGGVGGREVGGTYTGKLALFYRNFVLYVPTEKGNSPIAVTRCRTLWKIRRKRYLLERSNSTIHHRIFLTYRRLSEAPVIWNSHVFYPLILMLIFRFCKRCHRFFNHKFVNWKDISSFPSKI